MGLELFIGRSGSGKSQHILEDIKKVQQNYPRQMIYYLSPEQTTFSVEYRLSADKDLGGLGMIEVLSFERLAQKLLEKYGAKKTLILDELGKIMLLRRIIEQNSTSLQFAQGALKHFGYLKAISETLAELNRAQIDASAMIESLKAEKSGGLLASKAQEIALIQDIYWQNLLAKDWLDESGIIGELTNLLAEKNILHDSAIYIDGFEYFTIQQLKLIEQFLRQAPKVVIALCLDLKSNGALFTKQRQNYEYLQEMALKNQCRFEVTATENNNPAKKAALNFLEKNYEKGKIEPLADSGEAVKVIECQNPKHEVETAAIIVRSLVRSYGLRYNEIAVMANDLTNYQNYFAKIFPLYQIPYFLDENIRLFSHPLLELINSIMEIHLSNWSYKSVFSYLRSDLLCLEKEEIDTLENYCLSCGIKGAASWLKNTPWTWQGKSNKWESKKPWNEDELFHIDDLRRRISRPLAELLQKLKGKITTKEALSQIIAYLEFLQVPAQLAKWQDEALNAGDYNLAQIHGQIWDEVMASFAQLLEINGEEETEIKDIALLLQAAFSNISLGKVPLGLDQVFIGSPKRSRLKNLKAVILLGVNEGVLPAKVTAQGVFTLPELNVLRRFGWADALEKIYGEEFSIYKTLTAAQDKLYLTYALADSEGKSQRSSALISKVRKFFFFFILVSEESFWQENLLNRHISASTALKALQNKDEQLLEPETAEVILQWFAENEPQQLEIIKQMQKDEPQTLLKMDNALAKGLRLSVSAVEKYRSCPYAYFLNYILRLHERDIYTLDKMNIGQFYHKAMEELTNKLMALGKDWSTIDEEHLEKLIKETMEELLPQLENEILLSSGRLGFIKDKLYATLTKSAYDLAQNSRQGAFRAIKTELAFGMEGEEFTLTLEDGSKIYLRGRIDLLEAAQGREKKYLRIVDFKSGNNDLPLDEVYYGLKIQLITYLNIALKKMPGYERAGVLYRYIKNPFLKEKRRISSAEAKKKYLKEIRPKGLLVGELEPICLADKEFKEKMESDILPVKLKKEGKECFKDYGFNPPKEMTDNLFDQHSAVATKEQFEALEKHTEKIIKKVGAAILQGDFSVKPYRYKSKDGCQYCNYSSICRFHARENSTYNTLNTLSRKEIWTKLEEEKA